MNACAPAYHEVMATREAILDDPILDTEMAGHVAGLSPRRIQQLVKAGEIPNHGKPRRILVRMSEVVRVCGDPLDIAS